jgi:hypothetical protein
MQLLCIGDVGITNEDLSQCMWMPPGGVIPGDEVRVLFNWELPVGEVINPTPRSRGPRLLAHPDSPNVVRRWSPGFATLATNHILDAGEEGLANTQRSLSQVGFTTVGAGRTGDEITRPLFWETAEGRLAVINWVLPETHPDWKAVPGPNCWPGPEQAERTIQELKRKTDWVLVIVHWSDEHFSYPRPEDRSIARQLARMGADLVVGHHPHVVRGMEIIGSCPVFYSVGNFYFSDTYDRHAGRILPWAPRHCEGLGVQVSFWRGKSPEHQVLSFWQTRERAILDPVRRAAKRMERVSRPLRRFQNPGYAEWYAVKRDRFDKWGIKWHFGVRRRGIRGTMRRLLQLSHARLHGGR